MKQLKIAKDERYRYLSQRLVRWYNSHGREFPWRETIDPYEIWVSEILLQQTQASRCVDYYQRFLEKFPDLDSLARASWRNVLPVWRGLGYYRRGQNMLRAAKLIVTEYDGEFPDDYDELRKLPGVGPYTAAAISSFAFGKPYPALDTNLLRVLSRYLGVQEDRVAHEAEGLFQQHKRVSSKMNQSLMDVGALFCRSGVVSCERCPLRAQCDFVAKGRSLPKKRSRRQVDSLQEVGAACIHRDGRILLAKRKRSRGGEWEFPGGKREAGESLRACLKREIQEELGIEVSVRPPFLKQDILVGKQRYRLCFCRCQILRGREKAYEHEKLIWVEPDKLKQYKLAETNTAALSYLSKKR